MAKVGGKGVFGGQVSRLMLGEVEDLWDMVAIAMYPSKKAMLKMITDPGYIEVPSIVRLDLKASSTLKRRLVLMFRSGS